MSDVKDTLFSEVASRPDMNGMDQHILDAWDAEGTFKTSLEKNKDKPLFTFYDGPPYATGKPHYGHVLQSAMKDTVLRYKTMRGFYVPRRVGWDTHGLPVEVLVEKELGLKTKQDVEAYGIEKFNQKCREAALRYIDEFASTLKRIGRWADYDNGYATLDLNYMESEWWVFKQLWEKDLVYKDFRSTPYCIRCATPLSNFETGMGYKDKYDDSVYVLFEVNEATSLAVWTTTPWTLPANVAVAFSSEVEYVAVTSEGREVIIAKDRVEAVFGADTSVARSVSHEELANLRYTPPYQQETEGEAYRVLPAEFVTTEEGTGLVHIAPAFGVEDFELAKKNDLPIVRTVDTNGVFLESIATWGGQLIWDANPKIIADLKERGLLLKKENIKHSYPHCWRCDEPLIYYALDTWFVRVSNIKDKLLAENENINWIPGHVKKGRFAKGIESAPDWSVSRNRFWSVPIPIWECEKCEARTCVGSIEELQQTTNAGDDIQDIHRPYVDDMTGTCSDCGGVTKRVPEVLDVWFDSGSMPFSQWHYPFENTEMIENGFPADFIGESIEMTRAWFYVMHVLSVAVKDTRAYNNVIASGIIFGDDGNKLSKKLKNYPDIDPTLEKVGADTLRLFFLSSTLGEPYVFAEKELMQLYRSFTSTLWNVYSFFVGYANTSKWKPQEGQPQVSHILDQWILARLHQLQYDVTTVCDEYRLDSAARKLHGFVDDLSNWYVRRSRRRFQNQATDEERGQALSTLYYVLVEYVKLLAPFAPFVTEEIFKNLTGKQSVHLEDLPDAAAVSDDDTAILATMQTARDIVSEALAARAAAKVKVRQPLKTLAAAGVSDLPPEVIDMIREEVNVDEVIGGEEGVQLDTQITEDLKARGIAREVIRHGQVLRRNAGYALDDVVTLLLHTEDETLQSILVAQQETITTALQANSVVTEGEMDEQKDIQIEGNTIHIGVKK